MKNEEQFSLEDVKLQRLLNRYLRLKVSTDGLTIKEPHLDEDLLTAFVEGNLARRETRPVIGHLINCSFCRHLTAELVKLDLAFADEEMIISKNESQPAKVSEVLNGLLARIFGNSENAVFAHQEKEEADETSDSEKNKE